MNLYRHTSGIAEAGQLRTQCIATSYRSYPTWKIKACRSRNRSATSLRRKYLWMKVENKLPKPTASKLQSNDYRRLKWCLHQDRQRRREECIHHRQLKASSSRKRPSRSQVARTSTLRMSSSVANSLARSTLSSGLIRQALPHRNSKSLPFFMQDRPRRQIAHLEMTNLGLRACNSKYFPQSRRCLTRKKTKKMPSPRDIMIWSKSRLANRSALRRNETTREDSTWVCQCRQ